MSELQSNREVELASPLGEDVLLLRRMTVTERLGRPFQCELEMLSENPDIQIDDILGQKITARLRLLDDETRYFSAHVTRFSYAGVRDRYFLYRAVAHPWLYFLTRTADCRIFQNMKAPDIIKTIFRDFGFSDFRDSLSGSYRTWGYCVQYRETAFNFVNRLMEQEGIYYYFEHENDKHTLVMVDSSSAHRPFPGYSKVPYSPYQEGHRREPDHIYDWEVGREIQTGTYTLNDFDFERPRANLRVKSTMSHSHPHGSLEVFDYPGEYVETSDGENYVRARIQELQAEYERAEAGGTVRGLGAGYTFSLTDYPREDQNREYLVVEAVHELVSDLYESDRGDEEIGEEIYTGTFTVMPRDQQFRSPRVTPKPVIQGPQTAIVVGPSGKEIYTDQYGRVKLKFHWDRYSRADSDSSCWIRVAQVWAGNKWGTLFTPRIGQEVIVEFLEGDPDRPIITGRVYNKDNMPSHSLPSEETRSGIKTKSTTGGGPSNFNEIRFEDKKGSEQIFIQAERNQDIRVKNDHFEWIGNEFHQIVEKEQFELTKMDKHAELKMNRNVKVGMNDSLDVGLNQDIKVGMSHAMNAGMDVHIKGGMSVVVEAGVTLTIKAGSSFVSLTPAGVFISGPMVFINSGGAAGAGRGASPTSPRAPQEADTAPTLGDSPVPSPSQGSSPQSASFRSAAITGAPFVCNCAGQGTGTAGTQGGSQAQSAAGGARSAR